MAGPFFDVFVVGATDPTPPGQAKLASALSGPLGMPGTLITKGLAERKLCAGKGLVQSDAQALVRELKALGANTVIRPTSPGDTPTRRSVAPTRPEAPPPPVRSAPPPPTAAMQTMAAPPTTIDDPFAPPPSGPRALALDSGPKEAPPELDAFGPPPASSADLGFAPGGTAGMAPTPPVGRDPFAGGPEHEDPALELAVDPPAKPKVSSTISTEMARPSGSTSLPGASALNLSKMTASSSASGLSVDRAVAAEAYRVRCDKHGLLYDTRKASGCGKCLEKGRKLSAAIEEKATGVKIADFSDNPAKRAFIGLAFALVVGFIPAAYHAFRVGAKDIHRLRDEQEVLSRKPATEEIVRRFEELDGAVDNQATRSQRTTGIVWLVVAAGTLVGWYRVTT
jgi:hypothetical protein